MKVQTTSEVRKHFQEVIDHVHYTKIPMIISKNNKPWVMIQALPENDTELQEIVTDSINAKIAK
jgi:prevent-host-death family protein